MWIIFFTLKGFCDVVDDEVIWKKMMKKFLEDVFFPKG
jgi:hypothetical protein